MSNGYRGRFDWKLSVILVMSGAFAGNAEQEPPQQPQHLPGEFACTLVVRHPAVVAVSGQLCVRPAELVFLPAPHTDAVTRAAYSLRIALADVVSVAKSRTVLLLPAPSSLSVRTATAAVKYRVLGARLARLTLRTQYTFSGFANRDAALAAVKSALRSSPLSSSLAPASAQTPGTGLTSIPYRAPSSLGHSGSGWMHRRRSTDGEATAAEIGHWRSNTDASMLSTLRIWGRRRRRSSSSSDKALESSIKFAQPPSPPPSPNQSQFPQSDATPVDVQSKAKNNVPSLVNGAYINNSSNIISPTDSSEAAIAKSSGVKKRNFESLHLSLLRPSKVPPLPRASATAHELGRVSDDEHGQHQKLPPTMSTIDPSRLLQLPRYTTRLTAASDDDIEKYPTCEATKTSAVAATSSLVAPILRRLARTTPTSGTASPTTPTADKPDPYTISVTSRDAGGAINRRRTRQRSSSRGRHGEYADAAATVRARRRRSSSRRRMSMYSQAEADINSSAASGSISHPLIKASHVPIDDHGAKRWGVKIGPGFLWTVTAVVSMILFVCMGMLVVSLGMLMRVYTVLERLESFSRVT
ncbi:hypothetical protein HDU84_009807 [Entophlyctis sp. JEL0112]|nr:hypothetical protein HDU84_009807 [Entophlyctis sp. JEL0112]